MFYIFTYSKIGFISSLFICNTKGAFIHLMALLFQFRVSMWWSPNNIQTNGTIKTISPNANSNLWQSPISIPLWIRDVNPIIVSGEILFLGEVFNVSEWHDIYLRPSLCTHSSSKLSALWSSNSAWLHDDMGDASIQFRTMLTIPCQSGRCKNTRSEKSNLVSNFEFSKNN